MIHIFHSYKPKRLENYNDTSFGSEEGSPSYAIYFKCTRCSKTKREVFYGCGYWTIEELGLDPNEVVDVSHLWTAVQEKAKVE